MKKLLLTSLGVLLFTSLQAQDLVLNGQLSAGSSLVSVNDKANASSGGLDGNGYLRNPADGETGKQEDGIAVGVGINADYYLSKNIGVFAGTHILAKNFSIYNRDGGYWGRSTYSVAYLHIPFGISYLSPEITKGLKLYGRFGMSLDLKLSEELKGGDGAHYWNLAKNNTGADPTRGRNGDNKSMALFSPIHSGVLLQFGAEYALSEKFRPFIGFGVNQGVTNVLNSRLKHNDVNKTSITEDLKITLSTFTLDLGVRF